MISVRNVTKRYGHQRGVEDISFDVEEGEILGFLGPNGAGKTTTLRVITGFHPPTSGEVKVAGFDVFEEAEEVKQRIGYLPEQPPVYREMTVREYLHFVASVKGVPRAERAAHVEEVAGRVALEPVFKRLIANISKGYRQRVGLGQALIGSPPVLVLDEPTAGLDPKQIIEVRELIRDLKGEHTIILSSHILPEVSQVCERVVIINEGRLVAIDKPEALSQRIAGAQRLHVRVEGERKAVEAALEGVEGIESFTFISDGQPFEIQVTAEPGADVRRELFFRLAEAGQPMLELRPMDLSLEDVFLQLTTVERTESEVAAGA